MPNFPPYIAHFDGNQVSTSMGVEGTLGTNDAAGTARSLPFGVNPDNGAAYVWLLGTGVNIAGGTDVNVVSGTQQTLGTVGTVVGIGSMTNLATLHNGTVTETVPTGFNGGTLSVGTAAVELTFTGITKSMLITADLNNGTMLYLGGSTVAQDGANALTRLDPGEAASVDLDDANAALYVVAGTTGQKAYKWALT